MTRRGHILVIDDTTASAQVVCRHLHDAGYEVAHADNGTRGLEMALAKPPDLVLLDVMMPGIDGFEVCRRLRADARFAVTPIVMFTSLDESDDRLTGFGAGAIEFVNKAVPARELLARVDSLIKLKSLYDEVERQREELRAWSQLLEQRVEQKVREIELLSRLKRFFSPPLAQRIVAGGDDDALHAHRREVTVLFADLRGFTAFAEAFDESVVMQVLGRFHAAMGQLIHRHEGTLERFTGDGMMVFFNDPDPAPDHVSRAVLLAREMMERAIALQHDWSIQGADLALSVGLSCGVATLGTIGFESRVDYAAIGSVTNRAARLCSEAWPWEVLACPAVCSAIAAPGSFGSGRSLVLKGFAQPVQAFTILQASP